MVNGSRGVLPPGKRAVIPDQHAGNRHRVQLPLRETFHDDLAGVPLVSFLHFRLRQLPGAGNLTVKIVGVGSAQRGNVHARLRERDGADGMGMRDAAESGKRSVKLQMRRRIRGRAVSSFHLVAGLEVYHHHVFRLHAVVRHAGGLDHHQVLLPVGAADVAPGVNHDAPPHQFEIRFANLFLQCLQHRVFTLRFP